MQDFKIDFTEEDKATTGARGFEPMPSGFYEADITDIEIVEVASGDNKGKPMFKVEYTLSDGNFANRKLWSNVMLFNVLDKDGKPNNWFLAQFLKATGNSVALDAGTIPAIEDLQGKHVTLSVRKSVNKYKTQRSADGETVFQNTVNGFKLDDEATTSSKPAAKKKSSILP